MSESEVSEDQMALLLQGSRQFAFEQMSAGRRLLPFAARVKTDGEIEFVSFAKEDSEQPLEEIYAVTQQAMAQQAKDGVIVAASLVAAVQIQDPAKEFEQAIRIHLEAPGFVRQVLAPYAIVPDAEDANTASINLGEMIPVACEAEVFTG
ncbi:hypothetical protein OZN62_04640 [Aurantiacibacter sp. MUD11]|uniref:hypothetical protein n=1 Tax=Aurantiacibacter sp. MUD11 TaxID=3003265 RepID=UPI0022AACB5F|nr:hypothetical protein [Aurantiacibacter sp. MUD11]WAT18862.1 hypothetical protein OZN62_04640 [Aurantiacibacter sp. MUD11]